MGSMHSLQRKLSPLRREVAEKVYALTCGNGTNGRHKVATNKRGTATRCQLCGKKPEQIQA